MSTRRLIREAKARYDRERIATAIAENERLLSELHARRNAPCPWCEQLKETRG